MMFFLCGQPTLVLGSEITIFGNQNNGGVYSKTPDKEEKNQSAPPKPRKWEHTVHISPPSSAEAQTDVMTDVDTANTINIGSNDHTQTYFSHREQIEEFNEFAYNAVFVSDWGRYAEKIQMSQLWKTEKQRTAATNIKDTALLTFAPKGIRTAFKRVNATTQNTVRLDDSTPPIPYKPYDRVHDNFKGVDQENDAIAGIKLDSTTIIILGIALLGIAALGRKLPF